MSTLVDLVIKFNRARGSQATLTEQLTTARQRSSTLEQRKLAAERALTLVQEAAARIQRQLEFHISHVVTLALKTVQFESDYEFKVEFVKRRRGTECELWLLKNGEKCDPLVQTGGGVCDVLAFGLRVALLSIANTRDNVRKVLILDEPFRNLHGRAKQRRTSELVKALSREFGLQILMISDVEEINHAADCVFRLRLVDGVSVVEDYLP